MSNSLSEHYPPLIEGPAQGWQIPDVELTHRATSYIESSVSLYVVGELARRSYMVALAQSALNNAADEAYSPGNDSDDYQEHLNRLSKEAAIVLDSFCAIRDALDAYSEGWATKVVLPLQTAAHSGDLFVFTAAYFNGVETGIYPRWSADVDSFRRGIAETAWIIAKINSTEGDYPWDRNVIVHGEEAMVFPELDDLVIGLAPVHIVDGTPRWLTSAADSWPEWYWQICETGEAWVDTSAANTGD